nr:uncharacterized protein CTRU02_13528 [Colletotrichum truncatum]XP_036584637.1 uncharacterized protein CTRU02_05712 [Colletotrichum truncatum]KAF6783292.1 hypothetical protein CTRU02_13528 [Colletotrichum truncatum]KAF6794155.1 hypothetical protein CTRU02_05712 [Colletotrichum truncatum]
MKYPIDTTGKWALHQFVIVSKHVFDEVVNGDGWENVTEDVYQELCEMWEMELAPCYNPFVMPNRGLTDPLKPAAASSGYTGTMGHLRKRKNYRLRKGHVDIMQDTTDMTLGVSAADSRHVDLRQYESRPK